jgi:hypothetical protein
VDATKSRLLDQLAKASPDLQTVVKRIIETAPTPFNDENKLRPLLFEQDSAARLVPELRKCFSLEQLAPTTEENSKEKILWCDLEW